MEKRTSVRELRAHLKAHLEGAEPVVIGGAYLVRAILIPLPENSSYDPGSKRKALAEARKRWVKAVDLAFPD